VITSALLGLSAGFGDRLPASAPAPSVRALGLDRGHILEALESADWRLSVAASRLGVPRNTLRYRMSKFGILLERGLRERAQVVGGEPAQPSPDPVADTPRRAVEEVRA